MAQMACLVTLPDISSSAIGDFLGTLPQSALASASPTHHPTALPLAFPTDLHHANVLTTLHLVHALFLRPEYRTYFAEVNQTPRETALRGVLGMYLASETGWDTTANLLSAKAWASGEVGENKVAEFFGIQIMREREHESMKGITVGERYEPAAALAAATASLFKGLGGKMKGKCIGDDVVALLAKSQQEAKDDTVHKNEALSFAKMFCEAATESIPLLVDPYPDPPGDVFPAAPLRLLQDLAHQFGPSNAEIPLPPAEILADISPLPLPIDVLLHLGILDPHSLEQGDELWHATGTWWIGKKADLFNKPANDVEPQPPKIVKIPRSALEGLESASVEACREIVSHARFMKTSPEDEWKTRLTELDVARIFNGLDGVMDQRGMGVRLVLA